jgi:hypothetical protein
MTARAVLYTVQIPQTNAYCRVETINKHFCNFHYMHHMYCASLRERGTELSNLRQRPAMAICMAMAPGPSSLSAYSSHLCLPSVI